MFRLEYDSSGEVQDNLAFDRELLFMSKFSRFTTKQTADHNYHVEERARASSPIALYKRNLSPTSGIPGLISA